MEYTLRSQGCPSRPRASRLAPGRSVAGCGAARRMRRDQDDPSRDRTRHYSRRYRARLWFQVLRGICRQGDGGGRCEGAIIATKVGLEWRDGKVFRNSSRARIFASAKNRCAGCGPTTSTSIRSIGRVPLVPIDETAEECRRFSPRRQDPRDRRQQFLGSAQMEQFRSVAPLTLCSRPIIFSSVRSRRTCSLRPAEPPGGAASCAAGC